MNRALAAPIASGFGNDRRSPATRSPPPCDGGNDCSGCGEQCVIEHASLEGANRAQQPGKQQDGGRREIGVSIVHGTKPPPIHHGAPLNRVCRWRSGVAARETIRPPYGTPPHCT